MSRRRFSDLTWLRRFCGAESVAFDWLLLDAETGQVECESKDSDRLIGLSRVAPPEEEVRDGFRREGEPEPDGDRAGTTVLELEGILELDADARMSRRLWRLLSDAS